MRKCEVCDNETDVLFFLEGIEKMACEDCRKKGTLNPDILNNNKEVRRRMENELETPIGTKEQAKLSAGSVMVQTVTIEPPKEGSKAKLVIFNCKHPDREEPIKLSNMKVKKVQGNNETIKKEALWWNVDEDGNIRKNSATAHVMTFYGKALLKDFENATVETEEDASGYLCIKAY